MLTTLRADNSPHVVAVGFTFDPKTHIARVITSDGSQKAINAERSGVGVLSQVDGARWLSLEGRAGVNQDPAAVRDAELRYAQRYRTPAGKPQAGRDRGARHPGAGLLGPARPHQALSQPAGTTIRSCGRSLTASAPSAVTITMSMRAPQRPGK